MASKISARCARGPLASTQPRTSPVKFAASVAASAEGVPAHYQVERPVRASSCELWLSATSAVNCWALGCDKFLGRHLDRQNYVAELLATESRTAQCSALSTKNAEKYFVCSCIPNFEFHPLLIRSKPKRWFFQSQQLCSRDRSDSEWGS